MRYNRVTGLYLILLKSAIFQLAYTVSDVA